jgi:uroporphyrinogen-III synthase
MTKGLAGLRVVSFESRRSEDMASLIRRQGGEPFQAPSMQEVPLTNQTEALAFGEMLVAGRCDVLVLLTGVGLGMLVDALATRWSREEVSKALERAVLVCRGPKPVAALKEMGLRAAVTVPEPNTWRDILTAIDAEISLSGKRIAVQEYGVRNPELLDGLRQRGADVTPVPVYRWRLPDDIGPMRTAIEQAVSGDLDAAIFTSATQVEHLFQVARDMGQVDGLRDALLERIVVASIGPVTSEALARHGIEPDLAPAHPKMGHLVMALAQDGAKILGSKRQS